MRKRGGISGEILSRGQSAFNGLDTDSTLLILFKIWRLEPEWDVEGRRRREEGGRREGGRGREKKRARRAREDKRRKRVERGGEEEGVGLFVLIVERTLGKLN